MMLSAVVAQERAVYTPPAPYASSYEPSYGTALPYPSQSSTVQPYGAYPTAAYPTQASGYTPAHAPSPPMQPTYGAASAYGSPSAYSPPAAYASPPAATCCNECGFWFENDNCFDNLSLFLGLEGSKQPQDFGVNAHFGGRSSVNWGVPLWRDWGLGLQLGTSLNATANAVQVVERVEGTTGRTQSFSTLGIFQRFESGIFWGVGYDYLFQDYYDQFSLGQWRGRVGYFFNEFNEVGVQCAVRQHGDDGRFGAVPIRLTPLSQGSVYWKHTFATMATLGGWIGAAEGHGEANAALGDLRPTGAQFLFGSDVYVPLNDHFALFGEANFIMPPDTGTVDAYLGLEFRPWGGATIARRNRYAPMMPVANNTSMSVDLRRR